MSRKFVMSQYLSTADLYKDKAEHYEKCYRMLAERMVETEDLAYNAEEDQYYCPHSGDYIEDMIN